MQGIRAAGIWNSSRTPISGYARRLQNRKEIDMAHSAKKTTATVIPTMLYRDAPAAIDWLCNVLGFERRAVYPSEGNTVAHAELTFGNGMIMLGSAKEEGYGKLVTTPEKLGGTTQSAYVIVTDSDALYERVKAAGAEIVRELNTTDYGSREFACRDPEGHLWNFGTYDPWETPAK
jgi:uncharacterized glyoxalase superfamily protein PhnB